VSEVPRDLPLFPLGAVLFPDGLLVLKVFEARYLDLMATCLRERTPFGVIGLKRGAEVRRPGEAIDLESIGTLAELIDVDSGQPGILQVRCRGTQRFERGAAQQQANGLWLANVGTLPDDDEVAPPQATLDTVRALANAIGALREQGSQPFLSPLRFDCAGWVANRWCEILPISLAAKQKLMELPDPLVRLQLVDDFLRSKGVIT
jgi:Lon protease-like protein